MFRICGVDQLNHFVNVFNSDECFKTARNIHIYAISHTCAYFMVDFYLTAFVRKSTGPFDI